MAHLVQPNFELLFQHMKDAADRAQFFLVSSGFVANSSSLINSAPIQEQFHQEMGAFIGSVDQLIKAWGGITVEYPDEKDNSPVRTRLIGCVGLNDFDSRWALIVDNSGGMSATSMSVSMMGGSVKLLRSDELRNSHNKAQSKT